jgi:hypothetical protein
MIGWAVAGVVALRRYRRWAGPDGGRELREMDAWEAARVRTSFQGRRVGLGFLLLALYALGHAVFSLVSGTWSTGVASVVATAALLLAGLAQRAAAPGVREVLDERDLPSFDRETSRRRLRRTRQFGVVAVGSFAVATALLAIGVPRDSTVLLVAAGAVGVVGLVAGFGFLWASAWRYGDEEPATDG